LAREIKDGSMERIKRNSGRTVEQLGGGDLNQKGVKKVSELNLPRKLKTTEERSHHRRCVIARGFGVGEMGGKKKVATRPGFTKHLTLPKRNSNEWKRQGKKKGTQNEDCCAQKKKKNMNNKKMANWVKDLGGHECPLLAKGSTE